MLRSNSKHAVWEIHTVNPEGEKGKACGREDLQKRKDLSLE